MRKLFLAAILLSAFNAALGQIAITANVPTSSSLTSEPFLVLVGSTRQINVQISNTSGTTATPCGPSTTPSCVGTVNWSVGTVTGGETVTFTDPTHTAVSSISGAMPTVQVNVGSVAGNCTQTPASGSAGPYTLASSVSFTINAQSVDDPSKTTTFPFLVCGGISGTLANGDDSVIVIPSYQQAYQGQVMTLQSFVVGSVDETGVWSILTQPAVGDGVLSDTTFRDTLFSATVQGLYVIQFKSNATSATNTVEVYVGPDALPSYAATPEGTVPVECSNADTTTFPTDYEVGPGKTYANIEAAPNPSTWTPGTIMRIWNTDTTGISPTTFNEYLNVQNSGTRTQQMRVCGVPDSSGNLPILDAANATAASGNKLYGFGVVVLMPSSHYGYWQTGSAGPSYVSIAGLHLKDANPGNSFTTPGGTSATCPPNYTTSGTSCAWIAGAAGVYLGSGKDITVRGNDLELNTSGIFSAENSNNAWSTVTRRIAALGNHIHKMFWNGLQHGLYLQSFYLLAEGNLIDDPNTAETPGSDLKWRGVEGIFRYNSLGTGAARSADLIENQDACKYEEPATYTSMWALGDTAGPNIIAAYEESAQKDFFYGNLVWGATGDQYQIHYGEDHDGGLCARNGTLYAYNNSFPDAQVVFDNTTSGGYDTFFQPRVTAQNNLIWSPGTSLAIEKYEPLILTGITNFFHTGSMSITTPIVGGNYNGGTAHGWAAGCDYTCKWPLTNPIASTGNTVPTHIYDLTSANYLTGATDPVDPTTLAPTSGSPLIGAGASFSGFMAQLPVRYQYSVNTSALTARVSSSTIGAVEGSPPPVLNSITISPASASVGTGRTQAFTASCTYSGGSVSDCTAGVSWNSSNTAALTIATGGMATGVAVGSANVTASSGAITSNTAAVTVFPVASTTITGMPSQNFIIH